MYKRKLKSAESKVLKKSICNFHRMKFGLKSAKDFDLAETF